MKDDHDTLEDLSHRGSVSHHRLGEAVRCCVFNSTQVTIHLDFFVSINGPYLNMVFSSPDQFTRFVEQRIRKGAWRAN